MDFFSLFIFSDVCFWREEREREREREAWQGERVRMEDEEKGEGGGGGGNKQFYSLQFILMVFP